MKFIPWAGWIIALILGFLLWRSCKSGPEISPAKTDSVAQIAILEHRQDSVKIDSLQFLAHEWFKKYDSLYSSLSDTRKLAYVSAGKVKALSDSIKFYKSENDTLKELTVCGELVYQDSILLDLLNQAATQIDSLNTAHNKAKIQTDSVITDLNNDVTRLVKALGEVKGDYDGIVVKYNQEVRKGKTKGLISKILAVTAGILLTALLIKK